ncbi:transposase [Companilactobacillus hulinensis]|uniref:transposase n=1 Tax=Companilactobacillus hulinensis TaxID=2486007 RepID=UPI000F77002D|nr:transposase [Companilactobacillus hulinensis]
MLKHHCGTQITEADKERAINLISDKPWLIPATVLLEIIPVSIVAYGFFKNRRLQTKLKIEREKTMRAYLKQGKDKEMTLEEQHFLKHL